MPDTSADRLNQTDLGATPDADLLAALTIAQQPAVRDEVDPAGYQEFDYTSQSTDVQPTREAIQRRLEAARSLPVALHDEALEALRALDDWDAEHDAPPR